MSERCLTYAEQDTMDHLKGGVDGFSYFIFYPESSMF
jgi:hypothetical protein